MCAIYIHRAFHEREMQPDDATRDQAFIPRPEDTFVCEKARSEKHLWGKIRGFM